MFPSVAHRDRRISQCVKRVKKKSTSVATSNSGAAQPETSCELAHLSGCHVDLNAFLQGGSGANGFGLRF
jgi:hypothetical protein